MNEMQKLAEALRTIESVRSNKFREGQHLDIRIVGPSCSIVLLELFDGKRYAVRQEAIDDGIKTFGHDDFNIGILNAGKLVSIDWMNEVVDNDPQLLAMVAKQIGLS